MSTERIREAPGPGAIAQMAPILAAAGPAVPRLMERAERRLAAVAADEGEALGRHAEGTLAAGGKRLRPLLVFLCAGGRESDEVVAAGAAVELVHMAALVHDDVLDRAALRRGRPTVYEAAGRGAATATGDLLFARAFGELADTGHAEAIRALSTAASALVDGELMQRADAWRVDVSEERYARRCTLKTARLFGAACRMGGLLGDGAGAGADALGAYGERIGLAFQIFDDVLDVAGPAERTGKRRGADLLDGTVTLPLIRARGTDERLARLDLRSVTEPADAERVCDLIAATGALEDARDEALRHVEAAKATLDELPLDGSRRAALALVADGVVERYA